MFYVYTSRLTDGNMYTRYMLCQSCYDKLDLPNPYRTGVVHAEWIFTATGRVCSQSAAWIEGVLQNWYINSVDDTPSVWTEEHISELCENFIVIPKDTPAADVRSERHGHCIYQKPDDEFSWKPYLCSACGEKGGKNYTEFFPTTEQRWTVVRIMCDSMADFTLFSHCDYDYIVDEGLDNYYRRRHRTSSYSHSRPYDPVYYSRLAAVCERCGAKYNDLQRSVSETAKEARKDGWQIECNAKG